MENWNKLQASLAGLQLGDRAKAVGKSATSTLQLAKEATGAVGADAISELPAEYRQLEARLDARKAAFDSFLKVHKVFAISTYDYPYDMSDRLNGVTSSLSSVASAASSLLKSKSVASTSTDQRTKVTDPKTLPHAMSRAGLQASSTVGAVEPSASLQKAFDAYGHAFERVGSVRLHQDDAICADFLGPWQDFVDDKMIVAMKARQAVRTSRLELDAAKQALGRVDTSNPRREMLQSQVQEAQADLNTKLEVATTLIRTALDDAEGLKALDKLVTAQYDYHKQAAEALGKAKEEIASLRRW